MDEQFTEQDIASALRQLQEEGCLRRPADDPLMTQLADSQLVAYRPFVWSTSIDPTRRHDFVCRMMPPQDFMWVATVKDLTPWIEVLEAAVV